MAKRKYQIVIRRGAASDSLTAGETVIDFGKTDKHGKAMKANVRQSFIDSSVKYLKSNGFFDAKA